MHFPKVLELNDIPQRVNFIIPNLKIDLKKVSAEEEETRLLFLQII